MPDLRGRRVHPDLLGLFRYEEGPDPVPRPVQGAETMSTYPQYTKITQPRYTYRKQAVDCWACEGFGWPSPMGPSCEDNENECGECLGTGLDTIPWTEVYRRGKGLGR